MSDSLVFISARGLTQSSSTIEELTDIPVVTKKVKPIKAEEGSKPAVESKKRKAEDSTSPLTTKTESTPGSEGLSKNQKKKLAKKAKLEASSGPAPTANGTAKSGDKAKVRA